MEKALAETFNVSEDTINACLHKTSKTHGLSLAKVAEIVLKLGKKPLCVWSDIESHFEKGSLTEEQNLWASNKLIDRLKRQKNITILSLFSGGARTEGRLVARLVERGFHVKTLILVDMIYAEPNKGFQWLVDQGCVDEIYMLTFNDLVDMLQAGRFQNIDIIMSVHAWIEFPSKQGRLRGYIETNKMFQRVFTELSKLKDLPPWVNFRSRHIREKGPISQQVETITNKLNSFKLAQLELNRIGKLYNPEDLLHYGESNTLMNSFAGMVRTQVV